LWWNVAGCLAGIALALAIGGAGQLATARRGLSALDLPRPYAAALTTAALVIFAVCVWLTSLSGSGV